MAQSDSLEAFENEWRNGDRAKAKEMAKRLTHADGGAILAKYQALSLEQCVALIDQARERGDEEQRIEIDAYLLSEHEPQQIGGSFNG